MDFSNKQKNFQTSEKERQVSPNKWKSDYENKNPRTAAQINTFKLQAEKTFLQKKQEAMKKWMDRHREDCTKTIIRVCTTAKAIVERMAEEKNREMQEMMTEMEKAHQEEIRKIQLEARRAAIQDLLTMSNDQQKCLNNTETIEKDCGLRMAARELTGSYMLEKELVHNKMDVQDTSTAKRRRIDYNNKEPFCDIEMCAIRTLNPPSTRQIITELVKKPRHDITGINDVHKKTVEDQSRRYMENCCINISEETKKMQSGLKQDEHEKNQDSSEIPAAGLNQDPKTNQDRWSQHSRKVPIGLNQDPKTNQDRWIQNPRKISGGLNQDPKTNQDRWTQDPRKICSGLNQEPKMKKVRWNLDSRELHEGNQDSMEKSLCVLNHISKKCGDAVNQDSKKHRNEGNQDFIKSQPDGNHNHDLKRNYGELSQDPTQIHGGLNSILKKNPNGSNQGTIKNQSKSDPSPNRSQITVDHDLKMANQDVPLIAEQSSSFTCNSCGKTGPDMLLCAGCYGNFYCNEECQSRDWEQHQHWCSSE